MPTKSSRSQIKKKPCVHCGCIDYIYVSDKACSTCKCSPSFKKQIPEGGYRTISMDPPWWEAGGGKIKRGADRHYDLLKTIDMPRVIYGSGMFKPATDSHMYMWVTNNFLEDGLWLMKALGFRYITNIVWPKHKAGLGQYFRGKHELILFGVRGRGKAESVYQDTRSIVSVLDVPKQSRVHSRKPTESFEMIEARSKGPYLEMFQDPTCDRRPNWDGWGNHRRGAGSATTQA